MGELSAGLPWAYPTLWSSREGESAVLHLSSHLLPKLSGNSENRAWKTITKNPCNCHYVNDKLMKHRHKHKHTKQNSRYIESIVMES